MQQVGYMQDTDGKGGWEKGSILACSLGVMALAFFAPFPAHAAVTVPNVMQGLLCEMVAVATGTTGKAIASVAIIAMGIGALFGKISWNMAGIVLLGTALLFGSGSMVNVLGGSNTCTSGGSTFSFSCSGGAATGNMFDADVMTNYTAATGTDAQAMYTTNCASGSTNPGVFATILCFFKAVVGQILSSMYCQFQQFMVGPMTTAMTLFTMVFGFMIMTGMTNFTAKEATLFLLKMAIVWTFALNPAWGIGVGYRFFMAIAEEGSALVTQGSTAQLTDPDSMISSFMNFISGNPSASWSGNLTNSAYSSMSNWCVLYATIAVFLMLLFVPMVAMFLILLVTQYLGLYFKAALGYLTAMVLISFLFVLAPLFVGFALFKTTFPLFEQWVKYLISFSIQMVIVFGFLTMIQYVPVGTYFNELLGLLKQYDNTGAVSNQALPGHICSICEYTITSGTPDTIACNAGGTAKANEADTAAASPDTGYVIPVTALSQHPDFMRFAVSQALAYYLIFWVIQDFLRRVPEFARSIGGLNAAPALAGGDFGGMGIDALEERFMNFVRSNQGMATGLLAGGAAAALAAGEMKGKFGNPATLPRTALGTGATGSATSSQLAGTGKMNIDAAVRRIDNDPNTHGKCAASVRAALEAGGVNTAGHGEYARQYDPLLVREGFKDVSGSGYVPKKGDVVVIHATDGGGAGHIAMYDGHQWVSDHKQRTMLDGLHVTSYKIYRANGSETKGQTLAQAYAASAAAEAPAVTTPAKVTGTPANTPSSASTSAAGQGINSSILSVKEAAETRHLMKKFGLSEQQAAGITGNLVGESNLQGGVQEKGVTVGRGGLGWAQWTGPRRVQFEAFMRANPHLTPDEASQQFLDHELSTDYSGTIAAIKQTSNVQESTHSFLATFERPAVDNTSTRVVYAQQAIASLSGTPLASEMPITLASFPETGGGTGAVGGGELFAGLSSPGSAAVDNAVYLAPSASGVVDESGFHMNAVNTWQASQSSWGGMNPGSPDAEEKAAQKEAMDKKAADEAAAAAAAATAVSSALSNSNALVVMQNNTLGAIHALEMQVAASRAYLPEAVIAQAESTISSAYNALGTDNTQEGLNRALTQVQMMHRSLV